ncbi:ABC transporter permease [Litoribacter populi]|uniref:ABC transporter permease n=1 Tax=Litoribacter populi TaxID=2598460 RepID=UPI00117F0793|nr:ABC transporter permease [Litoribacter populi]
MLKNYFLISFRNLLKNKSATAIHILGLSVGIVSAILIGFYVHFERSYEDMHEKSENIFRLSLDLYDGNEFMLNDVETYYPLGPEFKESMPEVKDYARFMKIGKAEIATLSSDVRGYEDKIYAADLSAFNIFSYKLLGQSNLQKLEEPYTAVVTESFAKRFYDRTDILGEVLIFPGSDLQLEIVGVMEDLPQNTHLKFNMLMSHATIPTLRPWYEDNPWNANNEYTYLLMEDGVDVTAFNTKLKAYSEANEHIEDEVVISEKIGDIHLYSNKTFEPDVNSSAQLVNFILWVGIFILVLAWINYINLATAKAMVRAKEVGIRKAIGSSKRQLVFQFFCEAFVINLLASLTALVISIIALPYFISFSGLALNINHFGVANLAVVVAGITLVGTLVSGFYPAVILSGFNPMTVLKGKFSHSSKGIILRKGLVFFQFTATIVLLCVAFAVFFQVDYLTRTELGVAIDNTLVIRAPSQRDSVAKSSGINFLHRMSNENMVKNVSGAGSVPGSDFMEMSSSRGERRLGVDEHDGKHTFYHYGILGNYVDAMEITLLEGRSFGAESPNEMVLINETALYALGFTDAADAIGQKISFNRNGIPSEIIGVMADFYQRSPKEKHIPLILWQDQSPNNLIVKLDTDDTEQALATIQNLWNETFPDQVFDYYFLNDLYNYQFHQDRQFGKTVLLFTIISLIIAALGLFGLSSFMVKIKEKELGVRKVLGATTGSLVYMISRSYLLIIFIAGMMSIPVAILLIQSWLENYALQISLSWWLFGMPIGFILLIAIITVGLQTFKAAEANPIHALKNE